MAAQSTYPGAPVPLRIPRTPLESRQGAHPKTDVPLVWKSPPTRQLSREKRVEYESDVRERFYDDYLGSRTTGDARNEVLTGLAKLRYDPTIYRANALQGLVYDPARQVPAGVDFNTALRTEKAAQRQREIAQYRQRRMSDSQLHSRQMPSTEYRPFLEPLNPQPNLTGPPVVSASRDAPNQSVLKRSMDDTLNPEMVPGVEDWLSTASKKEQEVAEKFFRTLSSHGKRPDPASKAALHRSRVRSAVMTPSRKQREERNAQSAFKHLAREVSATQDPYQQPPQPSYSQRPLRRSNSGSEKSATKGSMFASNRQRPAHFTIHPDWASEGSDPYRKRK